MKYKINEPRGHVINANSYTVKWVAGLSQQHLQINMHKQHKIRNGANKYRSKKPSPTPTAAAAVESVLSA